MESYLDRTTVCSCETVLGLKVRFGAYKTMFKPPKAICRRFEAAVLVQFIFRYPAFCEVSFYDVFLIHAHRGASNEYPQPNVLGRNKEKISKSNQQTFLFRISSLGIYLVGIVTLAHLFLIKFSDYILLVS